MALADIVRSGIAIAKTVTASFQATVQHEAWTGNDGHAKPQYATAVPRQALVELSPELLRTTTGQEIKAKARVTFLDPVAVDVRDRITLPDGTTGPISFPEGMVDPSISRPFMLVVVIG